MNPAPALIRDFTPEATDALVRMWRASFEHGVGVKDPHAVSEQVEFFRTNVVPNNRVRTAWQGQELVGFLASTGESISQLYVRVDHLGQGIGSQLVRLAQAESSGNLWLFTFARNKRACSFYESRDFKVTARGFEPNWQLEDVKYVWSAPGAA